MQEADRIHPIWLIEEKIISFRVCVWITPVKDPTLMEIILRNNIKLISSMLHSISKGLIFCTTRSINRLNHDIFETILGNHAWKGATANFSLNAHTNNISEIE